MTSTNISTFSMATKCNRTASSTGRCQTGMSSTTHRSYKENTSTPTSIGEKNNAFRNKPELKYMVLFRQNKGTLTYYWPLPNVGYRVYQYLPFKRALSAYEMKREQCITR